MIVQLQNLADIRSRHQNEKIVLTVGTFDLLHVGHLRYLKAVKALGDIVVVMISSDDRVKARKGPQRPIIRETNRAQVLDELKMVNYVFIDPAKSLPTVVDPVHAQIAAELQPDICVADGAIDPRFKDVIDSDKFRIITLKRDKGYPAITSDEAASTSAIISHIIESKRLSASDDRDAPLQNSLVSPLIKFSDK